MSEINVAKNEVKNIASDGYEVLIDEAIENGVLKDIPIVRTAVSMYRAGRHLIDEHNIKKLKLFIDEVNKGQADDEEFEKYKKLVENNQDYLEYFLILLERQLDYEKSIMLAKLYKAFLRKKVSWDEVREYSEIVNRLLNSDLDLLKRQHMIVTNTAFVDDKILRNEGLGLVRKEKRTNAFVNNGGRGFVISPESLMQATSDEVKYIRTPFGDKLVAIITDQVL